MYVVLAFALAVGGGALGASLGTSHHRLCALISLGAGTLLGVTVFAICRRASRGCAGGGSCWPWVRVTRSSLFISKYVYHVCPACAASHFDEAATHRFSEIASAMMVALAIHCIADGMALAAGHEAKGSHSHGGRVLDFSLILAVCVHKVPEGLALGALLMGAGFNRAQTMMRVAAVESTTLLGGVLGWAFLHNLSSFWLDATVAHVGGGFRLPSPPRGAGRDSQTPQGPRADQFLHRLRRHRGVYTRAPNVLTAESDGQQALA